MLCRLVQLVTAFARDSGKSPPRWCRLHAAHCARCRRELKAAFALGAQLRADAVSARVTPPPFLAARALNTFKTPIPPHRRRVLLPLGLKPVAAAVALAVLLAVWHARRSPAVPSSPAATTLAALPLPLPAAWTPPDGGALLELSARWDDPLQRELELVLADAQAAGRSLAAAFLPASPVP